MSDDPHRLAKTAYLKRSTGHSLTDEESRAVEVFLTAPEGCAYAEGTEAMRKALLSHRQAASVFHRLMAFLPFRL